MNGCYGPSEGALMKRVLLFAAILIISTALCAAGEEQKKETEKEKDRSFLLALSVPFLDYTYIKEQDNFFAYGDDLLSLGLELTSLDTAFGFRLTDMFYLMGRFGFGIKWAGATGERPRPQNSFLILGVGPRLAFEARNLLVNVGIYLNYRYDDGQQVQMGPVETGINYGEDRGHTLALEGYFGVEYLVLDNFAVGGKLSLGYLHIWREEAIHDEDDFVRKTEFNGVDLGIHISTSIFF